MNTNKDFIQNLAVYLLTDHIYPSVDSVASEIESNAKLAEKVNSFLYDKSSVLVDELQNHPLYQELLYDVESEMAEIQENCYRNSIT